MAYTKQTWTNGSVGATPLSAARLGHVEDGIEAAASTADSAASAAGVVAGDLADLVELVAALTERVTLLETPAAYVAITTTGSTFSPIVSLVGESTGAVTWELSDGTALATGGSPTINFGSSATRVVHLKVTDGSTDKLADVRTFNIGFDHTQDSGTYNLGAGYDHTAQAVTGLAHVNAMTGLVNFLAATTSLTGAIDFTGMSDLEYIECYQAHLTGVTLTGCSSLIRLCLEQNHLSTLDLNPVAATLRDLRAANQNGGSGGLTFTTLTSDMAVLYHFCVRDQPVFNAPPLSRMPSLTQLWNWNTGQSGTFDIGGNTHIVELRSYDNAYTAVTGISGATALAYVDLSGSVLDETDIDGIIDAVNALATSGSRTLTLSDTAPPSSAADADIAALEGRGWTVTVDSAAATAPSTPGAPTLTAGNTQLGVSWTAPSNGGSAITSYTVRWRTSPSGSYSTHVVSSGTTYTITGLTNGTAYDVGVLATNAVGDSAYSTNATATPATAWSFSDTFGVDRADITALGTDGYTGWFGTAANVSSGNLNKTSSGSYQLITQTTDTAPVADYEVEITIPHSQISVGYQFIVLRWNGSNGVRVGLGGSSTIVFGDASGANVNDQSGTTDGGLNWVGTGDHTVRVRAVGSLIQLYLDGVLAAHATVTTNSTATGTSFGVGGGAVLTHRSLTAAAV